MVSEALIISGLGSAALAVGSFAAQLNGPLACSWPAKGADLLARLTAVRDSRGHGKARRALGGAVLAVLLTSGALAAYAAQPSAPETLPSEIVGVVGSGDQLSLKVKAADEVAPRIIKLGGAYGDGWVLKALTSSAATLARDGREVQVGLNPTGALGQDASAEPPTTVTVTLTAAQTARLNQALKEDDWDGRPKPGMTLNETQRFLSYTLSNRDRLYGLAGKLETPSEMNAALGSQADEFWGLMEKYNAGQYQQQIADFNRLGPISVYVPAGGNNGAFFAAAVVTGAYLKDGPVDAAGGKTWTVAMPMTPIVPVPGSPKARALAGLP